MTGRRGNHEIELEIREVLNQLGGGHKSVPLEGGCAASASGLVQEEPAQIPLQLWEVD